MFRASQVAQLIKKSTCNVRDLGLILGLERSPGVGHDNPLQYFCLENPHGLRSLVGYSPGGCKESDMTERLSTAQHISRQKIKILFFCLSSLILEDDKAALLR